MFTAKVENGVQQKLLRFPLPAAQPANTATFGGNTIHKHL